jgi:SNF2 family DNA or RNA helicase
VAEKAPKEKREFYIPRLNRERSLYGTEFEVKLRNELSQKAIARECADWIKKKATFMSNISSENMGGFLNIITAKDQITYLPLNGFTTTDIGCERGNNSYNMMTRFEAPNSGEFVRLFDTLWRDKFLEDLSGDILPNEATGFQESKIWHKLYGFQRDAALAIISKLEQYNGCILADSVGLGKTFTALAVIKYYENRNRNVLVLCPKKLSDNWRTFRENYTNNPIAADRLRYDVLFHTDLSREHGMSGSIDLAKLNWENYDLVVIDESHNVRNGGEAYGSDDRDNRYNILMKRVIQAGVKTKVLMLSATPVNNRFIDLRNQLALAYEGKPEIINEKLNAARPIDEIFRHAQKMFNQWSKQPSDQRTTSSLLKLLDFDFFEVLDSVTIARSRKHIEKYYNMEEIGKFPERLKPVSLRPDLTDLDNAINYNEIYAELMNLNLAVYIPTDFLLPSVVDKYIDRNVNINRAGRERGIRRLMSINLMKRLESSVYAFRLTLDRIKEFIEDTISEIDAFKNGGASIIETVKLPDDSNFDDDDHNTDFFTPGRKFKVDLADMDHISWRRELQKDADALGLLALMVKDITPEHDTKLQTLLRLISDKIERPVNNGNKKILIFSAFSDTATYLYDEVNAVVKRQFGLDAAMVTGSVDGRTTIPKFRATLNNVLTCFSPVSKDKHLLMPNDSTEISVLIGTDCISEGQNLQDCDYCVNYDIHWNPVRIIQRFGRIDRIGSRNAVIQLVNFWPNVTLDEYINLKSRVETRMKISVMTATGDDDLINAEEKGDLEYRKAQLERLQNEVVEIEEMQSGISIMDLGLNEFRLDLLECIKAGGDLDKTPFGLHTLVPAFGEYPPGVVFVLKNRAKGVNIAGRNRLHPFYMVYISDKGELVRDHLAPKEMLDALRLLCKGKTTPLPDLCRAFNAETKDGRNMRKYSALLGEAIASIIDVKAKSELEGFLSGERVSFLSNKISGLDDFELICFLVVR